MPTVEQGSIRRVTAIEQDGSGGRTRSLASQRGQLHENLSTLVIQAHLISQPVHLVRSEALRAIGKNNRMEQCASRHPIAKGTFWHPYDTRCLRGTQKALRAFGLHDTRKSNKARLTRKSQLPRPPAPSVGSASF